MCDIWRIRNPNVRCFLFQQNHISSFIERRLDFFLISNTLQELIIKTYILASFCIDHLPIFFFTFKRYASSGKRLLEIYQFINFKCWICRKNGKPNFQNSLLDQDKITDKHLRCKYLKYEIRKFTINFSKNLVKEENKDWNFLEKELKTIEKNLIFKQTSTILNVNKNIKIYMYQKCKWYKN